MKPNGTHFVVRLAVLALCAVGLLTSSASAESVHGNFTLTAEAHWGRLLLTPGEYEFAMSKDTYGYMVTVRSKETGWSGMVMAEAASDAQPGKATELILAKSEAGLYVRELCLADPGVTLNYALAKPGKLTRLTKAPTPSTTLASAAEAQ